MKQLVQEDKSLWRIKNNYIKDSEACSDCQNFWKKMEGVKENNVKDLEELIKKHM